MARSEADRGGWDAGRGAARDRRGDRNGGAAQPRLAGLASPLALANLLRGSVAPALGMACLWPLFRYQAFAMPLFPRGATAPLPWSAALSAHEAFLLAMAVVLAGLVALGRRAAGKRGASAGGPSMPDWPALLALAPLASLGAVVAFLTTAGALPDAAYWLAAGLSALGFAALYLAWAGFFSRGFSAHDIAVLGVSMFLSYLLFSRVAPLGVLAEGRALCVFGPPLSVLLLAWSRRPEGDEGPGLPGQTAAASDDAAKTTAVFDPLVLTIAAFLLVGAAARGVADYYGETADTRFAISLLASLALMLLCLLFYRVRRTGHGRQGGGTPEATGLAMAVWVGLALVFLLGLFVMLVMGNRGLGGDLVVFARTLMTFVLFVLLCDLVSLRDASPVLAFAVVGLGVETLSWGISYSLVPRLLASGRLAASSSGVVTAVMLATVAFAVVAVAAYLARRRAAAPLGGADAMASSPGPGKGDPGRSGGPAPAGEGAAGEVAHGGRPAGLATLTDDQLSCLLAGRFGLTQRECDVTIRYASGFSLRKVAEEMGISLSTAQSHSKAAYRKLDVHSRNDLIELLDRLRRDDDS